MSRHCRIETHHAIGSNDKRGLMLAEEIEWERYIGGCLSEIVVGRDWHSRPCMEGGVGGVVGDFVHRILAVEALHGDVGHAAQLDGRSAQCHHGVPALCGKGGGVVVFLFNLHSWCGGRNGGPLVFAAGHSRCGLTGASGGTCVFKNGSKGSVQCYGHRAGIDDNAVVPMDEPVTAVGSGGDGGGIVGAGGLGGDSSGAHGIVGGVSRHGVGVLFLDIGEVAPAVGSLVSGKTAAGDVDGDLSGDIIKHIVSERWRNCGLSDNFCQSCTASKSIIANRCDGIRNGNGRKPIATIKRFVANRSDSIGNYCIHASQKQHI